MIVLNLLGKAARFGVFRNLFYLSQDGNFKKYVFVKIILVVDEIGILKLWRLITQGK